MQNTSQDAAVLVAAYKAWCGWQQLRSTRLRNKHFTYGDQWRDTMVTPSGECVTEREYFSRSGTPPITNNLLRHLVKTIVGRFRSEHLGKDIDHDELDSCALEEFLISGCCLQRIDVEGGMGHEVPQVRNVNVNRFFANAMTDPLCRDLEIVGEIHDMSLADLLRRVAPGNRRKAARVRTLYSNLSDDRIAQFTAQVGADTQSGTRFWHTESGKCRTIEVWTLESREVLVCHNRDTAQVWMETLDTARKAKRQPHVTTRWDIATVWHCRWFAPSGELLCEYDSPFPHASHPFVLKLYPLTDGEVHAFIEDVIDQQKIVNRLITLLDRVMAASAKGVLLFPDTALPDGYSWREVRELWQSSEGILPYSPSLGAAKPEQISVNNTDFGAFGMISLQMKLMEEISGVSGALQGKNINAGNSAALYQSEAQHAAVALTDVFQTFNAFRLARDRKAATLTRKATAES